MKSTDIPSKYLVPFANNDSAKVEIPVTTTDATRASQSLGFPPLTMQPPESGGVPPDGEDFNGAMNQVSRVAWWSQLGGQWPFDATFANDTNIGGYPAGAVVAAADGQGQWLSIADANTLNPDTGDGTQWVPRNAYGSTTLTGQTGGTVTLTPANAAKPVIQVAGALTSNLVIVVPAWQYSWVIINKTTGSYTTTVKTANGTGVAIPNSGAPSIAVCDGTNVTNTAPSYAAATTGDQVPRLSQIGGRKQRYNAGSYTFTVPAGVTTLYVTAAAGGGGGGGGGACDPSYGGGGGGGGGAGQWTYMNAQTVTPGQQIAITVGSGGAGGAATSHTGNAGSSGGNTVIGTLITLVGGSGGGGGQFGSSGTAPAGGSGGAGYPTGTDGSDGAGTANGSGGTGGPGAGSGVSGGGGGGRAGEGAGRPGYDGYGFGGGGGGGGASYGSQGSGLGGGAGSNGFVELEW